MSRTGFALESGGSAQERRRVRRAAAAQGDLRLRGFTLHQLTYRESLRDIEACLGSLQGKLLITSDATTELPVGKKADQLREDGAALAVGLVLGELAILAVAMAVTVGFAQELELVDVDEAPVLRRYSAFMSSCPFPIGW
jgi:hypothetical protein